MISPLHFWESAARSALGLRRLLVDSHAPFGALPLGRPSLAPAATDRQASSAMVSRPWAMAVKSPILAIWISAAWSYLT